MQATRGDNDTERPMWAEKGGLDFEGRARWDAWTAVKGMSQSKAMLQFVKVNTLHARSTALALCWHCDCQTAAVLCAKWFAYPEAPDFIMQDALVHSQEIGMCILLACVRDNPWNISKACKTDIYSAVHAFHGKFSIMSWPAQHTF